MGQTIRVNPLTPNTHFKKIRDSSDSELAKHIRIPILLADNRQQKNPFLSVSLRSKSVSSASQYTVPLTLHLKRTYKATSLDGAKHPR